ncbi:MAG: ectoine synthase [Actinobacteria bacterium]|nr:ectoine synthase [Actinomycetota bacterium]MCB9389821.1 ectoine synthase [Acidimicrobiia bacterium]
MIIRSLESILGTDRETNAPTWKSRRLLLAADGMGFSLHDTVLGAGTVTEMRYVNHLEAVYCIEGSADLTDHATGQVHRIEPGVVYALNEHDHHTLTVIDEFRCVCVFNPPCVGTETHDAHGGYPLLTEEEA